MGKNVLGDASGNFATKMDLPPPPPTERKGTRKTAATTATGLDTENAAKIVTDDNENGNENEAIGLAALTELYV